MLPTIQSPLSAFAALGLKLEVMSVDAKKQSRFPRDGETVSVTYTGRLDNEGGKTPTEDFCYVRDNVRSDGQAMLSVPPAFLVCCDCTDGCRDPSKCACALATGPAPRGGALGPYDRRGTLQNQTYRQS